jgi:hypothetical protein
MKKKPPLPHESFRVVSVLKLNTVVKNGKNPTAASLSTFSGVRLQRVST